jgi:predicted alpha/beta superfamily hydrolase
MLDKADIFAKHLVSNAQTHAYWQHQTAPRFSLQGPGKPTRCARLFAAWVSTFLVETLPGFISARWAERFRRRHFICRGVDETAQRLIHRKLIEPLIIVAVANIGEERIHEYAPTPGVIEPKDHPRKRSRGLAPIYGQFLIEELKPFIDKKYRTKPDAEFTGLGGSSLGGLATLAMGIFYSEVFTRLIVMSPSIWWDDYAIFRLVGILGKKPPLKIWLDTGTDEPGWELARDLRNYLIDKGWHLGVDLSYLEVKGAAHSEAAWAARVEPALRFLFPWAREL